MKDLDFNNILTDTLATFKNYWKPLMLIALISTAISIVFQGLMLIVPITSLRIVGVNSYLFLSLVITLTLWIINLYFVSRLSVTLISSANDAYNGNQVAIRHSYKEAKYNTGRYIGYSILTGIITFIPLMMLGLYNFNLFRVPRPTERIIMALIGGTIAFLLHVALQFVPFITVLGKRDESVIEKSFQIVRQKYIKVALLTLLPIVLSMPIWVIDKIPYFSQFELSAQGIKLLLTAIFTIGITPFVSLYQLNIFKRLVEEESQETEMQEMEDSLYLR
ncbi:MAG: hypothetical protein BGO41_15010 [Clostridiales bacterium 38-18]|nr:MAG: hypothetical protein BGO41_15010 [Clostridiales bacterium 38-18]